eukprot:TRINITY_DN95392_c0_g1_i1.p1 TRINITY_DN95392_c0_g1~~TRINITY_DN95392_c0_g1_i1.p1  ORF type:complete len:314 (+),score=57.79 TRINITY_DN95392_c0_g1_i1:58-999(+)
MASSSAEASGSRKRPRSNFSLDDVCHSCGNVFVADEKFCRKCGVKRRASGQDGVEDKLSELKKQALIHNTRDSMLDDIFDAWDKDGSGELEIEEILPHYMKASNQQDKFERDVRNKFNLFMKTQGKKPTDGITPPLFKKWLSKLSDEQVAGHWLKHCKGVSQEISAINVANAVMTEHANKTLKELLQLPPSAIRGISNDASASLATLGIASIRELGTWRFFKIARAINTLADKESAGGSSSGHGMNIKNALDKGYEAHTLKSMLDLPVTVFNMLPDSAAEPLSTMNIKTIRQLANRKFFHWANAMVELEKYES